jgi:hypothetical protein
VRWETLVAELKAHLPGRETNSDNDKPVSSANQLT